MGLKLSTLPSQPHPQPAKTGQAAIITLYFLIIKKFSLSLSLFLSPSRDSDEAVPDRCKERVLKTMKEFPSSVEVQISCCQVLSNIAVTGKGRNKLYPVI